ncbi:MAG TPA: hypothetical protein VG894_04160 [Bauldia sp.]|nr:hypothetical protein [Bauldia sp.]
MNDTLFILHLLGFGAAIASSIGNFVILRLVAEAPGDRPVLAKVPPRLARIGQGGLGLLWLTGLIMLWTIFGGPQKVPSSFWFSAKILFVILVTIAVAMAGITLKRVQAGDMAAAKRLPAYGIAMAVLLVLIVICAVLAFNAYH